MNRMLFASFPLALLLLLNFWFSSSHGFVLKQPSCLHHAMAGTNIASTINARRVTLCRPSNTLRQMSFDPNTVFESILSSSGYFLLSDELGAAGGEGAVSYSKASYYTILALYLISLPGLWSTIQRTTKVKIQNKTYLSPGAQSTDGRNLRQEAAEIMAYMKANNYVVKDAGETITFEGIVQRSLSQAFFLAFVTALGMASLALVLQIQFNELELPIIGKPNWYLLTLVSPYAGIYYWKKGDRVDQCSVKLQTNEDETENEIVVQGSEEELDRMWRTLGWREKGMVKVEGLLKQYQ